MATRTKGNWAPYRISHGRDEDDRLNFYVSHQGHHVAHAKLSGDEKNVADIHVREDHRRRGLASAMYDHIESVTGKKLKPAGIQTPEGRSFWNARGKK